MPCSFCGVWVADGIVKKYSLSWGRKHPATRSLISVDGETHIKLIGPDVYVKIGWWRTSKDGGIFLLRCRGCWLRHRKIYEALLVDTDELSHCSSDDYFDEVTDVYC